MSQAQTELCGKCGAEIDVSRRVDFTLKNGTRVQILLRQRNSTVLATPQGLVKLRPQLSVERKAMPTLEELVQTSANELVVLCQRVADNRGAYLPAAAEEAAKLKLEWENLRMPPNLNYVLQTRIEQQKDRLRRRMIRFLAAVL